jgi:FixJ family two-component response regulator
MTGPDLQSELILRGHRIPIVFITARSDEAVRTRVIDSGAVAYLLKPLSDTALLDAIRAALRLRSGDPSI